MCIKPSTIRNPHYYTDRKNRNAKVCQDERLLNIEIPCGQCHECRALKAEGWKIRLMEEYKSCGCGQFVTLTISEKAGAELEAIAGSKDDKDIAILAVKRFRERWRKKHKKSCRHLFITELGHKGTERLHLHGMIFEENEKFGKFKWKNRYNKKDGRISDDLQQLWKYGWTLCGYSDMNEAIIGYCLKYIQKVDKDHEGYYGRILCSPGIGKEYTNKEENKSRHRWNKEQTIIKYKHKNGKEKSLPMYYKNKLFSQYKREKLRIYNEEKGITWVNGYKFKSEDHKAIARTRIFLCKEETRLKQWQATKARYEWKGGKKIEENKARYIQYGNDYWDTIKGIWSKKQILSAGITNGNGQEWWLSERNEWESGSSTNR